MKEIQRPIQHMYSEACEKLLDSIVICVVFSVLTRCPYGRCLPQRTKGASLTAHHWQGQCIGCLITAPLSIRLNSHHPILLCMYRIHMVGILAVWAALRVGPGDLIPDRPIRLPNATIHKHVRIMYIPMAPAVFGAGSNK